MVDSKRQNKVTPQSDDEFSHWQLPDVTEAPDDSLSNLFGYSHGRTQQEKPAEECQSVAPLTIAELEAMQAEAEKEGFEQGKQDGHAIGLEQGRLEGLEQGHKEGFEQGEQQGFEAGKQQASDMIARLEQLINQFEQPLAIVDTEVEAQLLTLASSLAKAVVTHELKTHPEHILSAMRVGIASLPLKEQLVKIRVNADDAAIIKTLYPAEQLQKNQWQIEIDPTLNNGDCIIDSVRSTVDLTLKQRLNQVLAELDDNAQQLQHQANELKAKGQYQTQDVDDFSAAKVAHEAAALSSENCDAASGVTQEGVNESVQTQSSQDQAADSLSTEGSLSVKDSFSTKEGLSTNEGSLTDESTSATDSVLENHCAESTDTKQELPLQQATEGDVNEPPTSTTE